MEMLEYARENLGRVLGFEDDTNNYVKEDYLSHIEFVRYPSSKTYVGIAKFGNGTTSFLVPPSDFPTKVLKVSLKILFLRIDAHHGFEKAINLRAQLGLEFHETLDYDYLDYGRGLLRRKKGSLRRDHLTPRLSAKLDKTMQRSIHPFVKTFAEEEN
ncbi:hypothetical protein RND71_015718 [Anisodus tanguticus]|uniref:Uncharacterized protein n=1 Tax=Anisodus tanguticus TaxID=243964 RepID=A0AAE1VLC7_9SOLA|nr:hypothetical protein RND71_015718 [Anisodus tanguticus]